MMPEDFDWVRLVRTYPLSALAIAAVGGFYLGLRHGPAVLEALAGLAAAEVTRRVSGLVDAEPA